MSKIMRYSEFISENVTNLISDDQVLDFTPFKEHGIDYSVVMKENEVAILFCVVLPPSRRLINFTPARAHNENNAETFTFDLPFPWSVWYFAFVPNAWSKQNMENAYINNIAAHRTKPRITLSSHESGWPFPSINGTCTGQQVYPPCNNLFEFVNTAISEFFFHGFNLDAPSVSPMMEEFLRRTYNMPNASLANLYDHFNHTYGIDDYNLTHQKEPFLKMFSHWEQQSTRSITRDKALFPEPGHHTVWSKDAKQVRPAMITH